MSTDWTKILQQILNYQADIDFQAKQIYFGNPDVFALLMSITFIKFVP
jgi:hypothetical protein